METRLSPRLPIAIRQTAYNWDRCQTCSTLRLPYKLARRLKASHCLLPPTVECCTCLLSGLNNIGVHVSGARFINPRAAYVNAITSNVPQHYISTALSYI